PRLVAYGGKSMIRDDLDGFLNGQHARFLPRLLLRCSLRRNPLRNKSLFLVMNRELSRACLPVAGFPFAQIRSEPPMFLDRDLSGKYVVTVASNNRRPYSVDK